jgi:FkbM family methyltransferase
LWLIGGCVGEDPLPDRSKKLYSQNDEELIIRDFFDDRKGGFFVDVGAYHWQDLSTTFFLEKHLGWSGIAIDAQADFATGYKKYRPRTKFFSYAVSDTSGRTVTLYLAWGLSSTDSGWLKQFSGKAIQQRTVEVPTITLNDLLERNNVNTIDFLSMDIEGGEPAALAGFDIEKYKPALVCVEAGLETRPQLTAYFESHSYERIEQTRDDVNWYFKPKVPPANKASQRAH